MPSRSTCGSPARDAGLLRVAGDVPAQHTSGPARRVYSGRSISPPGGTLSTPAATYPVPSALERTAPWLLALTLAIAALLRVREALLTPMWFDEIFTLWSARLGPAGLLRLLAQDMHPPLYFMMAWAWRALGGENELWLKSLSMLFGLATIAAAYGFARELFGRPAALVAATLLTLHRTAVYFSQEFRSFSLLWLLLLLCAWLAWRWIERARRRDGVLFIGCAAAALYTHYLAGIVLAFLGLWGVIALHRDRTRLLHWVGLHLAVTVIFAPQLPTFVQQVVRNREHWIRPATLEDLVTLTRQICFAALYMIPPMAVLALLPLMRSGQRRAASLLWTMTLPTVLLTWMLTANGAHLFISRYMFFGLPAWMALVAAGVCGLRWRWAAWALAIGLVGFDARSFVLHRPHVEAAALSRAADYLKPRLEPDDLVFCADTHSLFFMRQHLPDRARYLLLLTPPHLPYYEGALLVPNAWRATPADFERAHVEGRRWWALRTRHGGIPSVAAAALVSALAPVPPAQFDIVTVWAGQADSVSVR